jgi:glycosyltransferase involved in cell wall biosynthesis
VNGEGGIASHFADLAAGLLELGHDVRAVVLANDGPEFNLPSELTGLRILRVPTEMPRWLHQLARWRWRAHSIAGLWHRSRRAAAVLRQAHAREPFDAIETTSSGLLAMAYLSDRTRPPVVTRVSTLSRQLVHHSGTRPAWNERREDRWEKKLVRDSDVILTHTRQHQAEIGREWGWAADSIRIIPHGIAVPPWSEVISFRPGERKRLLFVGRCETRKGIDVLLQALPEVLAALPAVDCEIIGSDAGDYWQNTWLARAPAELRGRVRFCGGLSDEAVKQAYRQCDLFVAPSLYESFGLIYVEAMAWSKAVVGGRTGGVPEVVADGQTGRLVTPGSVAELSAALIDLLTDDDRRTAWGRSGRQRVEALFSRSALAQASAALYAKMAARRPARP